MRNIENTHLTLKVLGRGRYQVTAHFEGEEKSIIITDSIFIDDAFNSDEGTTKMFKSVDDAKQALIDTIFIEQL